MIEAGTLRAVIQLQVKSGGQDASGQPATTWTTTAKVFARVVGVNGSENFRGMQFDPEMTHQVTTRWIPNVSPLNQIVTDDGMVLDILSVDYPERKTELLSIMCKQRIGWLDADITGGGGGGGGVTITLVPFTTPAEGDFAWPHGLGTTPKGCTINPATSGGLGLVEFSQIPRFDATNIYLYASAAGLVGELEVYL